MNYIPLNVKTHYSLLDSLIKIEDLIKFIKENNIPSVGITDYNMFGAMEFIKLCTDNNIKPIIGIEVNISDLNMYLYARNYEGYINLLNIVSIRNTDVLTLEDIKRLSKNLICVTKDYINYLNYKEIYELVYLSYNNLTEKKEALLISSNVVYIKENYYFNSNDKEYLIYLKMIKDGKTIEDYNSYEFDNELNKDIDEIDKNTTYEFSKLIDIVIPKMKYKLPVYSENKIELIKYLTNKGLNKRLNNNIPQNYIERLNYELDVIISMDFTDYFLIVYDFILYAKKNGIIVGPGRGSAAGSLVSYSLGITNIDPLKYDLKFERFLNPERITMPDIDTDFEYLKRDEVINYVKTKYGFDRVANIISFDTLLPKQVLRDVGRILKIDTSKIDKLVSTIKDKETFKDLKNNEYFTNVVKESTEYEKLVRISSHLEGLKRHTSIHAAGVIISSEPLMNKVPLYKSSDIILTGFSQEYLESLGLLKIDFLSIRNLTIIGNIINKIKEEKKIYIDINKIPLNDLKTLQVFYNADTIGIFQFESEGMMSFLKSLKVRNFDDLIVAIALYRPGARDHIDEFIKVREGKMKPNYLINELTDIIKDTNGIIVYQEQIIEILKRIGGFTYAKADIIRRAMSKKKEDVIEKYRSEFVSGAIKINVSEKTANQIYDLVLRFASYGFNKSHSVAYALLAYQMAFLKAHFPEYFMTDELNMLNNDGTKIKAYIDEARRFGLVFGGVNVNKSTNLYEYIANEVILPLSIIKNVGKEASSYIIEERKKGLFKDYLDFIKRTYSTKVNTKVLENLIMSGALDIFNLNRKTMINNLQEAIYYANLCEKIDESLVEKPEIIIYEEYEESELLKKEYELFGFYLKNHPVTRYKRNGICLTKDMTKYFDKVINVLVMIDNIKEITTKNNDKMAFINGSDEYGKIDIVLFPNVYKTCFGIKKGDIIKVTGRVERRMSTYQLVSNKLEKV